MNYIGSKSKLSKYIVPILEQNLNDDDIFVDLFCGGCNIVSNINCKNKIAVDNNKYLIALYKHVQAGRDVPDFISKDEYYKIRSNKNFYDDWLVGFAGFCCSYRSKFFHGWCGNNHIDKTNKIQNYQRGQINSLLRTNLDNIEFICSDYRNFKIEANAVVYCDPPYSNTKVHYNKNFDNEIFWNYCINLSKNNKVFISEYTAPDCFKCIFEKERKSSVDYRQQQKTVTEKLFVYDENWDK